jgi:hypothetical protein
MLLCYIQLLTLSMRLTSYFLFPEYVCFPLSLTHNIYMDSVSKRQRSESCLLAFVNLSFKFCFAILAIICASDVAERNPNNQRKKHRKDFLYPI